MSIVRYNKEIINSIINNNIRYQLSQEVIDLISDLSEKVGDPTYDRTPNFDKSYKAEKYEKQYKYERSKNYNKFNKKNYDEEFNMGNFETTELKKKEGIELYIDIIRRYLNKITDKTYESSCEKIYEILDMSIKSASNDDLDKISNTIFCIASNNVFYSSLYSLLYSELIKKYEIFRVKLNTSFSNYQNIILNIKYVNSNEKYDEYCENIKVNDNNKTLLLFYTNLMKVNVLMKDNIIDIILFIYERFFELIEEDNKKEIVEELSEILYILIKNGYEYINTCERWELIDLKINQVSKLKSKDKPSISSKTIFKHMDILDEFN